MSLVGAGYTAEYMRVRVTTCRTLKLNTFLWSACRSFVLTDARLVPQTGAARISHCVKWLGAVIQGDYVVSYLLCCSSEAGGRGIRGG